uniref:Uncharacterized protein n=1 Tax=Arundo donax TaxID=35708 RepID=A0A0A8Y9M7_ARUDO
MYFSPMAETFLLFITVSAYPLCKGSNL